VRVAEFKQRSFAQRVGTAGENQFRLMADRQHLTVAIKVEEDFGVDFICQAEQASSPKSANPVIPAHFAVCVRATTALTGRIEFSRTDAANMLRYRQPLVFVLVHLFDQAAATCYYRILDLDFGSRLSQFLNSSNESMGLTPADCRPEASFRSDLLPALRPSATRLTQLALAELRLKALIPGATVELRLDKDGETAIIVADDYFDFFEQLPEIERDSVYRTAFGRPDLFRSRAADLPFKSAIPEVLADAPDQLVVAGRIVNDETRLEVSGPEGTATAAFTYTRIGTHYGWVHRDGLAITVSKAKPIHDGTFAHETQLLIDHDADCRLDDLSTDLRKLLNVAVPGAVVRETDGSFVMEADYFQLPRLCEIVRAHAEARNLHGWDPEAIQLRDITDPRCRLTMLALGTWSIEPERFPNLALYIDSERNPVDPHTADRVPRAARVSVVMNTARATIIATVSGTAIELQVDDRMIGLGGFTAQDFHLDTRALAARDEPYPEIVLSRDISIVLDPAGVRLSDAPFWIDGLGYCPLDGADSD
jgi:hypothetical protein